MEGQKTLKCMSAAHESKDSHSVLSGGSKKEIEGTRKQGREHTLLGVEMERVVPPTLPLFSGLFYGGGGFEDSLRRGKLLNLELLLMPCS